MGLDQPLSYLKVGFMPSSLAKLYKVKVRGCLISITIACSRLRRSPDVVGGVENARSAFSTPPTTFFARRSRASIRRERVKTLRIRHVLRAVAKGMASCPKRLLCGIILFDYKEYIVKEEEKDEACPKPLLNRLRK